MPIPRFTPLVLIASATLVAPGALAKSWQQPVIELAVGGPEIVDHRVLIAALFNAGDAWMEVDNAPLFDVLQAPGSVSEAAYDGVNAVFFQEAWTGNPQQLALTFTHVVDGEILEMDMAINAEHHIFTADPDEEPSAYDLQNLLTHELGHGLGLDHLGVEEATMFHRINPGETLKRDLAPEDVVTLEGLYEAQQASSPGGCAASGGPPLFAGVLLLFLSALRLRPARTHRLERN